MTATTCDVCEEPMMAESVWERTCFVCWRTLYEARKRAERIRREAYMKARRQFVRLADRALEAERLAAEERLEGEEE